MISSDSEFESELTAALQRLREQITRMVAPALTPFVEQHRQMVTSALTPFVEQHRQIVTSALAALAGQHCQMAKLAAQCSQQPAPALVRLRTADLVLIVQICAFVLLFEVLFIGWRLAAAVGPETQSKYMDITELIGLALALSLLIKNR